MFGLRQQCGKFLHFPAIQRTQAGELRRSRSVGYYALAGEMITTRELDSVKVYSTQFPFLIVCVCRQPT
jgi:hypothetical protein